MSGDVVAELRGWAQDVQTAAFWRGSEGGEAGEALAAFFTKTADLIASQAAEIGQLKKERDAALDNDWVAAPAYAAKVEQCRQYRDRADHLEQTLLGLLHHAMGTKWEHVKTGGKYTILGACRIEATNTPAYLYRSDSDGTVWARPMDEFLDGRFTRTLTNGGENGR